MLTQCVWFRMKHWNIINCKRMFLRQAQRFAMLCIENRSSKNNHIQNEWSIEIHSTYVFLVCKYEILIKRESSDVTQLMQSPDRILSGSQNKSIFADIFFWISNGMFPHIGNTLRITAFSPFLTKGQKYSSFTLTWIMSF